MINDYANIFRTLFVCAGLLFPAFTGTLLYAQYEDVWAFGQYAGLDFSHNPPVAVETAIDGRGEANASVCDSQGRLLFYTDGTLVWDKNGDLMPNGDYLLPVSLLPGDWTPTTSSCQGTLIMPVPGSSNQYYIFSLTSIETGNGRLYYSVVDMRLNNGMGDIAGNQKGILLDSMLSEKMTSVTGDRCNIWLIVRTQSGNTFKAYTISAAGIDPIPQESQVGVVFGPLLTGQIAFSPDGKKLAVCNVPLGGGGGGDLEIFDFDRATGILSNPVVLDDAHSYYGAAFSPDNSKLYGSSMDSVYQYDLLALQPAASRIGVSPVDFSSLKLAPDGKIYFNYTGDLSAINFPNLAGSGCQVVPNAVNLLPAAPDRLSGLPNVVSTIEYDMTLTGQIFPATCFAVQTLVTALDTSTGWDYVWNSGTTGSALIADTPGAYWVSYHTPPCNYHTDTFHVSFPNGVLPTIFIQSACRSADNGYAYAYTYPGDLVTYSYTWMRGSDTLSVMDTLQAVPSGNYSLHVQTTTGCDTLLFFDIPEEDFRVSFAVSDTLICVGDTIQLTNTSDADFLSYHWAFGNDDTTGLSDPPPYIYPESGAYRLMLAGEGEVCTDTVYQTILVDQPLLPAFEIEPKQVCAGQPLYFYPRTDSTTVQLVWEMEEQARTESGIQARYQHGFATGGTFPVTLSVQSRACPDTSITDSIRVYPYPEIDLGPDSSICLHGQPVYLKNLREAPLHPHRQVWSTGDTADILKVTHPGVYTLSVTTEPIGCTTTETITISKDCYIDVPNAFTPNADGHNDYFLPRQLLSESLTRFRMRVFNRWGQLLFETTNLSGRGWDGNFNGKAQPTGVYLYRIETDFSNGQQEKYEGNVTLLR